MLHGGECYLVRMVVFGSASNSIFKEMINSIENVHFNVQVTFDSLFHLHVGTRIRTFSCYLILGGK